MGSLGFMTPFGINHMEAVLNGVTGLERGVPLMLRHRLQVGGTGVHAPGDWVVDSLKRGNWVSLMVQ